MPRLLVFLVLTGVCARQLPNLPKLLPVDAARQDPSLQVVRDQVLAAVRARNARTVMSFVSPRVRWDSTSDTEGSDWRRLDEALSRPEDDQWTRLEESLKLGGAFTTRRGAVRGRLEFCAPYVFAAFPDVVPHEVHGEGMPWVVTDKDVEVHSAPDLKSAVLGRLSYALVQASGGERHDVRSYDTLWQTVALPEDQEGFILAEQIRNPEDGHVCFAKEGGSWLISLVARRGDP